MSRLRLHSRARRTAIFWLVLLIVAIGGINQYTGLRAQQHETARLSARLSVEVEHLCRAVLGARNFWIAVRSTTEPLVTDPSLTPSERESNRKFVVALTNVINAATDLAAECRQT